MAKKRIPGLIKPPNRRQPQRPPRLASIPVLPRGPKAYYIPKDLRIGTTGPGEPPAGFITPTNSRSEWVFYWALFKVLVPNEDPRKPPFTGYPGRFSYQIPFEGGRNRTGGGQVVDFIIEPHELTNGIPVAVRIQTEFHHHFTDSVTQAYEQLLRTRLARDYVVRDVHEQNLLIDKTGQGAVISAKNVLRGVHEPDPLRQGDPQRIRDRRL